MKIQAIPQKDALRQLVLSLLTALLLPLVNTTLIGPWRTMLASDVMASELLVQALGYLSEILNLACTYASLACVAYALVSGRKIVWTLLLTGISLPLLYLAAGIVDAAFYGGAVIGSAYLLYSGVSCVYELVRLAAAAIFCLLAIRGAQKRGEAESLFLLSLRGSYSRAAVTVAGITSLFMLLSHAAETVTLLLTYGAPVSMSEVLTLLSPYIMTLIWTILGYFLSYFILSVLKGRKTV